MENSEPRRITETNSPIQNNITTENKNHQNIQIAPQQNVQILTSNIKYPANQLVYLYKPNNISINQNNPNNLNNVIMNNQAVPAQVIFVNNIPTSNARTHYCPCCKTIVVPIKEEECNPGTCISLIFMTIFMTIFCICIFICQDCLRGDIYNFTCCTDIYYRCPNCKNIIYAHDSCKNICNFPCKFVFGCGWCCGKY